MKGKIWKVFFVILGSLTLSIYPMMISTGCGGWDPSLDDYRSLIEPSVLNDKLLTPFLLTDDDYFDYDNSSELKPEVANIQEWKQYFKKKTPNDDIWSLIYSSTIAEVDSMLNVIFQKDKASVPFRFQENKALKYILKKSDNGFLTYLKYAKECEPHVSVGWGYWDEPNRDYELMSALIERGESNLKNTESDYLKLRYAYQLVRLAHYSFDYEKALALYDQFVRTNNQNSIIKYWALSHKAGALKGIGKYNESAYLFAKIFDECPSRRLVASRSYKLNYNKNFNELIAMCKSPREKLPILFLEGLSSWESDLYMIEQLYAIDPASKYINTLLARFIRSIEIRTFNDDHYFFDGNYNQQEIQDLMIKFDEKINDEQNPNRHIWQFYAGYIQTLYQQPVAAEKYLSDAENNWPKEEAFPNEMVKYYHFVNKVALKDSISWEFEENIYQLIRWLELQQILNKSDAISYLLEKTASVYQKNEQQELVDLCLKVLPGSNEGNELNVSTIDQYIAFNKTSKRNDFRNYLFERYPYSINDMYEMKGRILLSNFDLEGAKESFEKSGRGGSGDLMADPFSYRIQDCHDCDYVEPKEKTYSVKSLVDRLLELKTLIHTDPDNADQYYFLMGNAFYNLSYFGNSWMALSDVYISPYGGYYDYYYYDSEYRKSHEFGTKNTLPALHCYEQVMALTTDEELAARACYLAAKCEYTFDFAQEGDGWTASSLDWIPFTEEERYYDGTWFFKILKDNYVETNYIKEVIRECSYFSTYLENSY